MTTSTRAITDFNIFRKNLAFSLHIQYISLLGISRFLLASLFFLDQNMSPMLDYKPRETGIAGFATHIRIFASLSSNDALEKIPLAVCTAYSSVWGLWCRIATRCGDEFFLCLQRRKDTPKSIYSPCFNSKNSRVFNYSSCPFDCATDCQVDMFTSVILFSTAAYCSLSLLQYAFLSVVNGFIHTRILPLLEL